MRQSTAPLPNFTHVGHYLTCASFPALTCRSGNHFGQLNLAITWSTVLTFMIIHLLRFRLADDEQDYRRVISTVAATGRLEAFSVSWVSRPLFHVSVFTTVAAERCRRLCAVAAEAKYNIKDVAASKKKWTVYALAVQNFLMDAHRDCCMYVLGLRIVVPTALRRPSGRLLRQRRSTPLQTLRRLLCRLLRQRNQLLSRRCGVSYASCCGSGSHYLWSTCLF